MNSFYQDDYQQSNNYNQNRQDQNNHQYKPNGHLLLDRRPENQSNIYSHFSKPKDKFGLSAFIPGLPHILSQQLQNKGILLLTCFVISLFCLFVIIFPELLFKICSWIPFFGIAKSSEEFGHFPALFKFSYAAFIVTLQVYLITENKRDIAQDFRTIEKDKRPTLFASSISTSYIFSASSLLIILLYTILYFNPIQIERSMQIDMTSFVDNPVQEKEPPPPKNTKKMAVQNAKNSGKSDPKKQVSPGQTKPKANPQKSQTKQAAKPTPPQPQTQPAQKPAQSQQQATQSAPPMPKPKAMQKGDSQTKPLFPSFKPRANSDERAVLSSSEQSVKDTNFASAYGGAGKPSSNPSPYAGGSPGKGPVLPSKPGGFSNGSGFGNSAPNNNPNGPTTVAAKRDVDFGPYVQDLQRRIQQAWTPTKSPNDKVVLFFTIKKDGSLVLSTIRVQSTTAPDAELAALQAIKSASPGFRPLPEGAASSVTFEWTFTQTGGKAISSRKY